MQRKIARFAALCLAIIFVAVGCNNHHQSRVIGSDGRSQTVADGQVYLADADNFDLSIVLGALKAGKVQNADELEKLINDPETGINSVDLDADDKYDFIAVQEEQTSNGKRYNFVAFPSTKGESDKVTVASIDLTRQPSGGYAVNGFYPSYIHGYQYSYYSDTFATPVGFYSWAYAPHPVVVLRPMGYYRTQYNWTPRPVIDIGVRRTTVSTYRTRTSVSPVTRSQQPPPSFTRPTASKVPTGLADIRKKAMSDSLSDRSPTKSYQASDPSRSVGKGSSFSPRPSSPSTTRSPSSPSPASRPSSPSTPSRSSGFGSAPKGPSMSRGGRR